MKAVFQGFISAQENAIFAVPKEYKGFVVGWDHFELKDGIDYDQFVIGEEYDITGITK